MAAKIKDTMMQGPYWMAVKLLLDKAVNWGCMNSYEQLDYYEQQLSMASEWEI